MLCAGLHQKTCVSTHKQSPTTAHYRAHSIPLPPMPQIRAKLEAVTGVPAEHQKVMLSGINQIVMGDKR